MRKANAKKHGKNKYNQYTNLLKFENVVITKHALDRFIQRNKLSRDESLRPEAKKKLYNTLIHAKLADIKNGCEYYIHTDEIYIIKNVTENGQRKKILKTILLTKESRIGRFGTSVDDINYARIGMKPINI